MFIKNRFLMQRVKKKFCLQSGTQMQIIKKVLFAIRNSNADNEQSTFAIRNAIKKHDTLYSAPELAAEAPEWAAETPE